MSFLAPLFFVALAGPGHSRPAAPDAEGEEGGRLLPVADVRAEDSVPGLAAAAHPALVPAAAAPGGAGADHPGVCAAAARSRPTPRRRSARARAKWWCCSTPATAWATARGGRRPWTRRATSCRGSAPPIARRSSPSARAPRSCCARPPSTARSTAPSPSAKPSASATRYAPALKVAGSLLAESQLPRREVVLISDFQRSGWRGQEGTSLPAGATLIADGDPGHGQPAEPERHRGVAAALALCQPGAGDGHGRHHQPLGDRGHQSAGDARGRRPAGGEPRRSAWTAAPARR